MSGQPWGTPDGADGAGADDAAAAGGLTDADREAAVAALDAHRDAGRLDDVGFEERSVRARRASTRADLDLLFIDLPEPHPTYGAPAWGVPAASTPPPLPATLPPAAPQYPAPQHPAGQQQYPLDVSQRRPLVGPETARKLVALAPFVAFGLFWFTKQWVFFLLIPVAGVLFGSQDKGGKKRERR